MAGIVAEGELTLATDHGRKVLGPGTVHWLPATTTRARPP
jgi:hypothetical protein